MKFNIDRDHLLKAVLIADSVVSSKNVNTILGNCLFKVSLHSLAVVGTDNEVSLTHTVDCVSDAEGTFTVNGKKITQILKELPKGEISISVDETFSVIIKSKVKELKGVFTLIGTARLEFPEIEKIDENGKIEIDQNILKSIIQKVSYAAAVDTIKPAFNGLYLVSEKNGNLTGVASDSRRLSVSSKKIGEKLEINEGIIIPLKTVREVMKVLSTGKCYFGITKNQCFFQIANTEIVSRLVDGQFPNYRQVIPKDYVMKIFVNTEKLMESLRRIMVFTKEPAFKVVLHFSKEKIVIEAKTADLGEAVEEVEVEGQNADKVTLGINSQYLMDSLKEIGSANVEIGITGQMSPLTIKPENDEETTAVIMPIQIRSAN